MDTFDYRDDAELRRLVRRIYGLDPERSAVPPQQISPHELCYTNSRTEVPLTRPDVMALLAMAAGAAGEWRTPSGHRPDPHAFMREQFMAILRRQIKTWTRDIGGVNMLLL